MKKYLVTMLLFISCCLQAEIQEKLTILSINDVYEVQAKDGLGGMAELAKMLKREKEKVTDAIVTVNGDFLSPSMLSTHYHGKHMVDLFNKIGVDLVVFGNHEFDFGAKTLEECMDASEFTWLGTNVLDKKGKPFHDACPHLIKEIGDVKVGFFGVCTPETKTLSRGGDEVDFAPVIETAKSAIKSLKEQGADAIVGITHLTIAEDEELAKNAPGIDLILGGHEHIPFTKQVGKTLVHKSGCDAHYLVRMDLNISKRINKEGAKTVKVIPEWSMIANLHQEKDLELAKVISNYEHVLDKELSSSICTSQTALCSQSNCVRSRETAIGNMIADAVLDSLDVQAVMINAGSIRGEAAYKAGHEISRKDVIKELPFANGCRALYISGSILKDALEFGVSCGPDLRGGFPQIAGIQLEYNPDLPIGRQIVKMTIGGDPIEPERQYLVAVTDYMAQGGDGYEMLLGLEVDQSASTEKILYSLVSSYLENESKIAPIVEGRIQVSDKKSTLVF